MFKKTLLSIFFLLIISCLAILVWYSPIIFKGYPVTIGASDGLVRAKNIALTGRNATENNLNIILSSKLIKQDGQESNSGNKFGTIFYSQMIKWFHPVDNRAVVLINCFLLAAALFIFSLAVRYLFGFKTAFIFALIYIFLPTNWALSQAVTFYQPALLFLSLFVLFFSWGTKKFTVNSEEIVNLKLWPGGFFLILSGIFLILACLARETFLLILPILFIFLWFVKLRKYLFYVFIPVIIILCVAWLPDFISNKNTYLLYFTTKTTENLKGSDYSYYVHLFPDPYTYHFNQKEFLSQKLDSEEGDLMARLGTQKVATNMGQAPINFWQRLRVGTVLTLRHVFRFFSITEIGGPFIFFLFFLGFYALKRQKTYWFKFSIFWLAGSIFLLAYINLAGRNHLMDFGWSIGLSVALGIILVAELLTDCFKKKTLIEILILLLTIYNLVLCGHVMWGQAYDKTTMPLVMAYAKEIQKSEIKATSVIATSLLSNDAYNINFLTDTSIVVFKPETIENLIDRKELKKAFDMYEVKYILGYSPELSQKIVKQTKVGIIADSSIKIKQEDLQMNNKNWLMNLIK